MQNTLTEADDTCEPLRRKAAEGIMLWKKDLVKIINIGIDEGIIKNSVNPEKVALHIIALTEFGFLLYSASKNRGQVDDMLELALEVAENTFVKS